MNRPAYHSITLHDSDNQPVALSRLWQEQHALLFFLRHPGCAICRQQLLRLRDLAPQFGALGVQLAAITMAEPYAAAVFGKLHNLPFPVYSDSKKASYLLFGFNEGTAQDVWGVPVLLRQAQAALQGQLIGSNQGQSIYQYGGLVLIARGSRTPRLVHVADPIYHYPPWEDVLSEAAHLNPS